MSRESPVFPALLLLAAVVAAGSSGRAVAEEGEVGQDDPGDVDRVDAQGEEEEGDEDLSKKLQNPVSDLVSIPLQFNWAQPVGPNGATRFNLQIQPVLPFNLTDAWNLIFRMVLPIQDEPALGPGSQARTGFGDALLSFFLSPSDSEGLIWGIGPYLVVPTGAEFSSGKWGIGPTAVVLMQAGSWTYGALVNQAWSFAGDETRDDLNRMFLQPFVAFTTDSGVSLAVNTESTVDWDAPSGEKWTIPLIFDVSKVSQIGSLPVSYGVGAGWYAEVPGDQGPDWLLRLTLTLLLPKG